MTGGPNAFQEPDRLARLLALSRDLEALPEVGRAISVADWVVEVHRAFAGEARVPESAAATAQLLLLYESSARPGALSELMSAGASSARVVVTARVASSSESRALRARMQALAEKHFPAEAGPSAVISTEVLLSKASDALALEQAKSLGISVALILLLLVAQLGWRDALLATPSNALPVGMILGVMGIAGIPLNVGTSLIASAAMGIAVDDTLHLLARVREARRRWGCLDGALLEALLTTGRPVVFAWATVTAGFLVLALSDFAVVRDLGMLMALCMTLCLLGDVFLLPAMLLQVARRDARRVAVLAEGDPERRGMVRMRTQEPLVYLTGERDFGWGWTEDLSQQGARVRTLSGPLPAGPVRLLWLRGQNGGARGRVVRAGRAGAEGEFAVAFDL
jgi:hypothetical protein